jgi:hypothetical protein
MREDGVRGADPDGEPDGLREGVFGGGSRGDVAVGKSMVAMSSLFTGGICGTGAPQEEQKRTLFASSSPQTEQ